MMEAVTATLTARGVPKFDIISEAFQAAVEVPATLEPRTVHLTESDTSFTWTPAGDVAGCRRAQRHCATERLSCGPVRKLCADCREGNCRSLGRARRRSSKG